MPEGLVPGEHEEDKAEHLPVDLVLGEVQFLEGAVALHTFTYEFEVLLARRYVAKAQLFEPPIFIKIVLDVKKAVTLTKRVLI